MSFCLSLLVTFVSSAITELFEMQADFSGTKDEPCIILRSSFPKGKGEGQFVGVVQPVEKHFESVLWCSKKTVMCLTTYSSSCKFLAAKN